MKPLSALCLTFVFAASAGAQSSTTAYSNGASLRASRAAAAKRSSRYALVAPDTDHVFPYILDGNNWSATLYVTNLENREIKVECEFVGTAGEEKEMDFDIGRGAFTTSKILPYGTTSFRTTGRGSTLTTAWAYCTADPRTDRFSGYVILRSQSPNQPVREFVTPLAPEQEPGFLLPYIQPAANQTELVIINTTTETDASFKVSIIDPDGNSLADTSFTLKPGELRLTVLNNEFKQLGDIPTSTVRVELTAGTEYVTGVGLRVGPSGTVALAPMTPVQ